MRFLKKNFLVIATIVISFLVIGVLVAEEKKTVEFTNNNIKSTVEKCEKILKASNGDTESIKMCQRIVKNKNMQVDFYTAYIDLLVFRIHHLNVIAFLLLIIPSMYGICKKLKYKYIKNALTRQSYTNFMKELLKESYKYIWLLPLITLYMMLIVSTYTTFDLTYAMTSYSVSWPYTLLSKPFLFIVLYMANILFHSFFFINISLIVAKKINKYIPCVIVSFILYIAIELFLEVGVSMLIFNIIFKNDFGIIFNVMNLFMFNTVFGIAPVLIFSFSAMLLSFLALYFTYRDKEQLVINCEKNI